MWRVYVFFSFFLFIPRCLNLKLWFLPHFMGGRCQVLLKLLISWKNETSHETTPTQLTASLTGNLWLSKLTQDSAIQSAIHWVTNLVVLHLPSCLKKTNKPELLGSRSSPGDWIRWVSIHLMSSQLSKKNHSVFFDSFEGPPEAVQTSQIFQKKIRWLRVKTLAPFRVP